MSPPAGYSAEEPLMFSAEPKFSSDDDAWEPPSLRTSDRDYLGRRSQKLRSCASLILVTLLPWILLTALASWNLLNFYKHTDHGIMASQILYSPVQHLIKYELREFNIALPGLGAEENPFVGEPSPELDAAWKGLYPSLLQLIPERDAKKLWGNGTIIFPHDEQRRYAIELDVFHELHCLNMIRKTLWADYYTTVPGYEHQQDDGLLSRKHMGHCIDQIRQSLMCAADVTPYTWQWDPEKQTYQNRYAPHTCRDFDGIRDWAVANAQVYKWDTAWREMNDPLDPNTWVDGYAGE